MKENPFAGRPTFVGLAGIELTDASVDHAEARVEITEDHMQPYGVVHGGLYTTLVETLASAGAALWARDQGMGGAMGVSNKTDFLRPVTGGVLLGRATPIHRGKTQQLWQVDITRETDGKLVAQGQVRMHNVDQTEF